MKKLMSFPKAKVFPCLDLYRCFLAHPCSVENFNASDAGSYYLSVLLSTLTDKDAPKASALLSLRCVCNLFKNASSQFVARKRRQQILDACSPFLYNEDKNVRQAAITVVLNYSVEFHLKEDEEGRIQAISAISSCFEKEVELQNMLRLATALGNLCHNSDETTNLALSMGIVFPRMSNLKAAAGE